MTFKSLITVLMICRQILQYKEILSEFLGLFESKGNIFFQLNSFTEETAFQLTYVVDSKTSLIDPFND